MRRCACGAYDVGRSLGIEDRGVFHSPERCGTEQVSEILEALAKALSECSALRGELAALREEMSPCDSHGGRRRACGQCFDSTVQHLENTRRELAEARALAERRFEERLTQEELTSAAEADAERLAEAVKDALDYDKVWEEGVEAGLQRALAAHDARKRGGA